jgi:hypothetical protein
MDEAYYLPFSKSLDPKVYQEWVVMPKDGKNAKKISAPKCAICAIAHALYLRLMAMTFIQAKKARKMYWRK